MSAGWYVTIGKGSNRPGVWCVYIDGDLISTHATRDAAATAANNHRPSTTEAGDDGE